MIPEKGTLNLLLFVDSLRTVGQAIIKIFFLGLLGFLLARKGFISQKGLDDMSKVVLYVTLPALIFYNFVTKFDATQLQFWWLFPLGGLALSITGLVCGWYFSSFLERTKRRQFTSLLGLQNSGYLPLALAASLLKAPMEDLAFIQIFFVMSGMSIVMWSVGVFLISDSAFSNTKSLKNLVSPPLIAISISLVLILTGWRTHIPRLVEETANFTGKITIPLIMIILGGILAEVRTRGKNPWKGIFLLIFLKSIIFPVVALAACFVFRPPEVLALVLLLETASPPATNLIVIGKHYGEQTSFLNQGLLYTYLASVFTIPVMISVLNLIYS